MAKNQSIVVKGTDIGIFETEQSEYISLTDISRDMDASNMDTIIQNWLRNRNTIELLGFWELMYNPNLTPRIRGVKKQAGLNSFVMTPKKWIENANAIVRNIEYICIMEQTREKTRAERNRTLTVDDAEKIKFGQRLVHPRCLDGSNPESFMNKTLCGDLLDMLVKLPSGIADLIIIDPPYNLDKNFNGFKFKSSSNDDYLNYLRSWFPNVVNLLKENGSLYLCGDWKCTSALQQVMEENLTVLNRITWQREKGRGALSNWKNGMEDIWFGVKNKNDYYFDVEAVKQKRKVLAPYKENGKPKDWEETENGNFRLTYPSNFWDDISIPYWSMPENTDHPTQKPEKLIAKLILASCPIDGVVLDPFLGSGTSSVVAKKLKRNYIGIEMNEEYGIWAEKRLEMAGNDNAIQGYVDGMFWERNTLNIQQKFVKEKQKASPSKIANLFDIEYEPNR
ncbi:MAG: KilA-N domain-containing protein [Bacteroidetes bacterium]|nr:KilA-N domain-containing protein [Bacteroidota bacterium]MBU1719672.1 KilA-N domain-containing protein [Bacteroidota bacterium]